MNKMLFFILILFLGFNASLVSQDLNSKTIGNLIVEQNFDSLAVYMADNIVLNLNEIEEDYEKIQAIELLTNFFTENPPVKYTLEHEGSATGDEASFGVGKLKTKELEFDTHFLIRDNKVSELCFEE